MIRSFTVRYDYLVVRSMFIPVEIVICCNQFVSLTRFDEDLNFRVLFNVDGSLKGPCRRSRMASHSRPNDVCMFCRVHLVYGPCTTT